MAHEPEELACIAEYTWFGELLDIPCVLSLDDEFHAEITFEELKREGCEPKAGCSHHQYVPAVDLPDGYW